MSSTTPSPPAGWFPDPGGTPQQRWWDGERWTGYLRAPGTHDAARPELPASATFWARAGALLVDQLVIGIPFFVLTGLLLGVLFVLLGSGPDAEALVFVLLIPLMLVLQLVVYAATFAYSIGFEGAGGGQTIGKWLLGVTVVDARTGAHPSRRDAGVRALVRVFASGTLLLGYLWMLWDDEDRTWHDMAATTRVVVVTGPRRPFGELLRSFSLRRTPGSAPGR